MKNSTRSFWGRGRSRTGHGSRLIPIAVGAAAVAMLALAVILLFPSSSSQSSQKRDKAYAKAKILDAWKRGDPASTLEMTRVSLETLPLDPFYLSFDGIAAYYASSEKPESDEKQSLLDEAVFSLRKAMASGGKLPVKAQVEYVLGKAYFQKGQPWFDLAAKYLEKAKTDGYEGKDTEQYLGLSFAGMQNHEEAVKHFESAIKQDSSDILMLSAAISYKEIGNLEKAGEMLSKAVASSTDAVVAQKARFMLGEMAMQRGELSKAQSLYQSIIDTDPRSAEAWYRLGLISEALKDPIKARAEWRKATSIDPNHIEARKKLAERL
ncbi:MAG: tetratricopeptide repeat protein [Spirochaetales bacterium]